MKGFSPRYTAPEVFGKVMTKIANVSVEEEMKGDVYSFAIIVWEMMARKIPWAHCKLQSFFFLFYFFSFLIFLKLKVKDASEIEFQVRSGKREPIPNSKGDQTLEILSTLIELSWCQNPNERPTFKQIDQKLSTM